MSGAFAPHPSDNVWLDLLRTLAIVLVLLRHGQRYVNAGPDVNLLEQFMLNGWSGVDLFFVLSGYLVTSGLIRELHTDGGINVVNYAFRRVRRIVPAYFFVLFLVVVGYFPFFEISSENLAARIGYHVLFLQDYFPSDINVVFWSLGVEAKFYAIIPLLLVPVMNLVAWPRILAVGLAIALLSTVIRGVLFVTKDLSEYQVFWSVLRSPFHTCLEPLVFGFLIAIFYSGGFVRLSPRTGCYLFAAIFAVLSCLLAYQELLAHIDLWDATFQPLVIAGLFALLLTAAISMKDVHLPMKAMFRFCARISYSLYLVHLPLIPLSYVLSESFGLGLAGFWVIYLSTSIVHSLIILTFIEYPFMKRKTAK